MGGKGKDNPRRRSHQGNKLNQSVVNDSKSSDSSTGGSGNNLEYSSSSFTHNNSLFQTSEDNSFRLGTDISSLSTSGGSISTSTPIGGTITKRDGNTVIKTQNREISHKSTPSKSKSKIVKNDSSFESLLILIVVIGLIVLYIVMPFESSDSSVVKLNLEKSFDELKLKFPLKNQKIWNDLISGILDVIDLNRQVIFLLIYSDNGINVRRLSESVAKIAAQTIKWQDNNIDPIVINSQQHLNIESYRSDHGKLITKYHTELEKRGVLVVHDLHLLEGTVARAFHTICDVYNPLVEQSIIIFTAQVDAGENSDKVTQVGEKLLNQIWSKDLDIDVLQALVTRLTYNVIKIQ